MTSSNQIKLGAVISYIAIGINIVTGLLYTPWMIHSIGKDNFGLYTLAMSVISLFVFDFGLSSAITRFVAKYLAEGRPEKADNCLGLVYKLYLFIDILLLAVLAGVFFFIPFIYKELTPVEIDKFKIVFAIAAVFSVISFPFIPVNGILSAHEKFIQLKLCDLAHKLFIVAAMTVCLLLGYGLYALVLINAVAGILTIGAKLMFIRKSTNTRINFHYRNRSELRSILGYSGWTTLISISQRFIFNIAPTILGIMSGSASIAVFGLAITLEGYVFTFATAINGLFLPRVSQIVAKENGDILPLMIRVGRIQILVIGLLIIGFVCLGKPFIHLWVGESFSQTYYCAVLLILPSFLHLPQEIAATTVVALNKIRLQAYVYLLMAAFNIVFTLLLTYHYGVIGTAVSIFVAYLIRTVGMDIVYYRELHINILRFFRESFGKMMLPLLSTLLLGLLIRHAIPVAGWSGFLLKGTMLVLFYAVIMWYGALKSDERRLLLSPFTQFLNNRW